MSAYGGHERTVRTVRVAGAEDLAQLQQIEAAADTMFAARFGPQPFGSEPPETGAARAAKPGGVMVAAEQSADGSGRGAGDMASDVAGEVVVGFVHVLEVDEQAHLEQLAVDPSCGRRGIGSSLVEAACDWARVRGHGRLTLRTFAEVPWNAPFYARRGFRVIAPIDTAFQRGLVESERRLGLDLLGERVVMARGLGR